MSEKKVLVVGGTGNPPSKPLLDGIPQALPFHVDLRTGHGFDAISKNLGQPDIVINCAALSIPRACEADPEAALAINVPYALVRWLSSFDENKTFLIHLSTDQVYEGTKSFYKEEDETIPVNAYGKSKVVAEQLILTNCPNFAILRSSIIFGPQTISPVPKSLPIQWIDSVLAKGEKMDFFHDEFRCPVYVRDLVTIIQTLTNGWISESKPMQLLVNVGGPDRVSRVQMAEAVAEIRGYKASINPVSSSSVSNLSTVSTVSLIYYAILSFASMTAASPKSFIYGEGAERDSETTRAGERESIWGPQFTRTMWRAARSAVSSLRRRRCSRWYSTAIPGPCIVHKRGADILHDPWFNKVWPFAIISALQ
nr:methionine adenosyltransferase 2 subunit beta [Ipomoea batatas]